ASQRRSRFAPERKQWIERRTRSCFGGLGGEPIEQAKLQRRREIEDVIADRDAAPDATVGRGAHAQWEVLGRKRGVRVSEGEPAALRRGMGGVDHLELFLVTG